MTKTAKSGHSAFIVKSSSLTRLSISPSLLAPVEVCFVEAVIVKSAEKFEVVFAEKMIKR